MSTTIPRSEIQKLSPGALLSLFELDATGIGGTLTRWAPHTNELGTGIVFQGNTYTPFPIMAEGFERTTEGSTPRPKLRAANLDGQVGALCREFDDLVGCIVTRRQTLTKFLDAVNFVSGTNPTAGAYEYLPEHWIIEQKTSETQEAIEWELASSCDATGLKLPARPMNADTCGWVKSSDCPYVGSCARTLTACKANWGASNALPFGGFPGLVRSQS